MPLHAQRPAAVRELDRLDEVVEHAPARGHDALAEQGEVLDSCLYTAPGKVGGGGAGTTWLVGSPADVADALQKYQQLGITHFILSDTPYMREVVRIGDQLLSRLNDPAIA